MKLAATNHRLIQKRHKDDLERGIESEAGKMSYKLHLTLQHMIPTLDIKVSFILQMQLSLTLISTISLANKNS